MKTAIIAIVIAIASPSFSQTREPKYPLKNQRTLYTDEQLAVARQNVAKYATAKKVLDDNLKVADEWAAWKDEDLISLITDSRVPRAFAVSATGCPVCGSKIK